MNTEQTLALQAAAQEVARLTARHSELCNLMEQRRGGSEAHGEIMAIDGKLADLARVMSRALLAEPVAPEAPAANTHANKEQPNDRPLESQLVGSSR